MRLPFRRRKQTASGRKPRIERQKQSIFQYSSNRSSSERHKRGDNSEEPASDFRDSGKKYLYRLAFVVALFASFAILFLGGKPKVVLVEGQTGIRDIQSYQTAANKAINGWQSYSKLTLDRQKVAQDITAAYPEIVQAEVTTPFFGRSPVIKLELARPAVIISSASDRLALDQRGIALFDMRRTASDFDVSQLPEVNDQTGASLEVGKPALTSAQVDFITEVKHQSEAKRMPLTSIILTAGGGELHIKHGDLPYFVKYNLYEDPRKSFGTFVAAREYTEKHSPKPREYIDVRVPERAYIK